MEDSQLLRDFVEHASEKAFGVLVDRYLSLVHSAALRQVQNPQMAEEVAQVVFLLLAHKASTLSRQVVLPGWLFRTTRFVAIRAVRSEQRRRRHEQEAFQMQQISSSEDAWRHIAPLLDEAMEQLGETDRNAMILRFFHGESLQRVGGTLGISEDAAKKRVSRAVAKLRTFFAGRGMAVSADALLMVIGTHSVQAAPAGLASTITAAAVKGATANGSILSLLKTTLKLMAWTKAKITAVTAVGLLLAALTTTIAIKEIKGHRAPMGPDIRMSIKWMVGKEYPMRMEMNQSTKTDVPGQPQPIVQEVKLIQYFDFSALKDLDNGGRQLELRFENQTMNVSQGGHSVLSFDSTQSPDQDVGNPVAPMLRLIVGAHIQYFVDAKGRLEKMEGVDELTKRMAAMGKPQEQTMVGQFLSADALKQYVSFADAMPDREVTVGDSWPLKKDVSTPIGILTLDMEYTFKNWEQHDDRKCAHVQAEGNISTQNNSSASGMMVEIKKGKISGEFWYDPALGMIVEANNDQDLLLKVTTRGQAMTSQFNRKVRLALVAE